MNPGKYCPKCFSRTQIECKSGTASYWIRRRCITCGLKFSVLGRNLPWPPENGVAAQQRDIALKALRQLCVTVQEISEVVGLSENHVGQITKTPL